MRISFAPARLQTISKGLAALAAVAAVSLVFGGGEARAVSDRVRSACERDYYKFCPSYEVGSTALRNCMTSKRRALSSRCLDALIDAGEVPRRYLKK